MLSHGRRGKMCRMVCGGSWTWWNAHAARCTGRHGVGGCGHALSPRGDAASFRSTAALQRVSGGCLSRRARRVLDGKHAGDEPWRHGRSAPRLRCEREPNRVSCGAPPELSLPAAPAHSPGVARAPGPRRGSCYGTIVGAVLGWRLVSAPRCPQLGRPNRHLHRHGVEKNLIHCRPAWWTRRMRAAIGPMTCALGASRALRRAEPRGRAAARPR